MYASARSIAGESSKNRGKNEHNIHDINTLKYNAFVYDSINVYKYLDELLPFNLLDEKSNDEFNSYIYRVCVNSKNNIFKLISLNID